MRNHAPVFINSFSRGGSNILWNVFLTHPDVCSPILETLEIFKIGRAGRWTGYQAAWLTRQPRFFGQKHLVSRRPISTAARRFIDATLYRWKLKTYTDSEMRYKSEYETYQPGEVERARLCAKNNNGLAFLSDILMEMYPDAAFFALVRSPLALWESYRRRRFMRSLDEFVTFYNRIAGRMLADAKRWPNYHLLRFEDLLGDPVNVIPRLYDQAGLDGEKVQKTRFKAKEHYKADGTRGTEFAENRHHWFEYGALPGFLSSDINQRHIQHLDTCECEVISTGLKDIMEQLGYPQLNPSTNR